MAAADASDGVLAETFLAALDTGVTGAASSSSLPLLPPGQTFVRPAGQTMMGPGLSTGMGEAATVAALNSWGSARDRELIQLKVDLGATQTIVASAFEQAKGALQAIVDNFRIEAANLRYDCQVEATQSLPRLELLVGEARARFVLQDPPLIHISVPT